MWLCFSALETRGRKKVKGSRGSRTGEDIYEDVDGIQENNSEVNTNWAYNNVMGG